MSVVVSAAWAAVVLVTFLGDPLVIGAVGLAVFWGGERLPVVGTRLDRRQGAVLLGTIIGALTLTTILKHGLAVTRPIDATNLPGRAGMPEFLWPFYRWVIGPGGYALPSGHAVAATVGWVGLSWTVFEDARTPAVIAWGAVAAIAASRVALGVHRPIEVIAGTALGLAYLLVTFRGLETPRRVLAFGGAFGLIGLLSFEMSVDGFLIAGVAMGATVGWELVRDQWHLVGLTALVGTLGALTAFLAVRHGPALAFVTGAGVLCGAGAMAVPLTVRGVKME